MTTTASPVIKLVTGTDYRQFEQLFLLIGSLRRYCPGVVLHVCDFGLTDGQRAYIRERHVLLDKPNSLPKSQPHPWYYKGAIAHYVAPVVGNAVVWIDADMFVLTDIQPHLDRVYAEMRARGRLVAAAAHDTTVAEGLVSEPAPFGAALMRDYDLDVPLLNSGFWMCRSREFMRRYADLTLKMPMEKLFEQNAFNFTVIENPGCLHPLDRFQWNLVANDLHQVNVDVSNDRVTTSGERGPAYILHATSTNRGRDLYRVRIPLSAEGKRVDLELRMIRTPAALLEFQKGLVLRTLKEEAPYLLRHRVWHAT